MTIIESIKKGLVPIHPEGYPFVALFALATCVLGWFYAPFFWIGLFLSLWCAYFFRDPQRITPLRQGLVVSPADGVVSSVEMAMPPAETGLSEVPLTRVSIFMSLLNMHVNRAPMSGKIRRVSYKRGKGVKAALDKSGDGNERNSVIIDTDYGAIGVTQIAGLMTRRIVCWSEPDATIDVGERFGLIRFGSQVDVYLPPNAEPCVVIGQSMVAGETILADIERNYPPAKDHKAH